MRTCLGLESTAHTLSAGVVDGDGHVLGMDGDTYVPDEGGLHPLKTSNHHVACFPSVIERALERAGTALEAIDLIAFSQGPGLGPCLRVGASIARALAAFLSIPIVGVNHCVAHVEIGRLACDVDDPLTLYVSGGNTIVSAFDCGRYQVFGETLDIALGNLLDTFARAAGLQHPGGPKLEALARGSTTYVDMPYTVKGMDLALSGLLTSSMNALASHSLADVAYSLQETAFSMVAEVTERALAHTEKKDVLITGGVAANGRLKEMIKMIAEEHGAAFHAVPRELAGDNGAMIAWTGLLQHGQAGGTPIGATAIIPKWRLDQVDIPWRGA